MRTVAITLSLKWLLLLVIFANPATSFTMNRISTGVLKKLPNGPGFQVSFQKKNQPFPNKPISLRQGLPKRRWKRSKGLSMLCFKILHLRVFSHLHGIQRKSRRILAALVIAVSIWMQGATEGGPQIAHASRLPVSVQLNGASMAARTGADWTTSTVDSEELIPVTFAPTSAVASELSTSTRVLNGKVMATGGAALLVGVPSVGVLVAKRDSHTLQATDGDTDELMLRNDTVGVIESPLKEETVSKRKPSENIEELLARHAELLETEKANGISLKRSELAPSFSKTDTIQEPLPNAKIEKTITKSSRLTSVGTKDNGTAANTARRSEEVQEVLSSRIELVAENGDAQKIDSEATLDKVAADTALEAEEGVGEEKGAILDITGERKDELLVAKTVFLTACIATIGMVVSHMHF